MGIKVTINGKQVTFDNLNKGEKISIGAKEKLDIKYVLDDINATTDLKYDKEIKQGETATIKFTVTAENGNTKNYEVEVYRYSSNEEIFASIMGVGVLCGLGYGTYRIIKKVKRKK